MAVDHSGGRPELEHSVQAVCVVESAACQQQRLLLVSRLQLVVVLR